MKVFQLNTFYGKGSTGRIAQGIHDLCVQEGIQCVSAYRFREDGRDFPDTWFATNWFEGHVHNRLAWWTGLQGCFSLLQTARLLKKVKQYQPDLIHLHNIHGSYLNYPLLFRYLKKSGVPVIWTLHDCLSMTGRCPHFLHSDCDRWKTGCHDCPQIHEFPAAKVDLTRLMWRKKKAWFTGVPRMVLCPPSQWLAGVIPESYMKDYPVRVMPNGIDREVFKPTKGNWRPAVGLRDSERVVLFVASPWSELKGLSDVKRFARELPSDCRVVMVGAEESEIRDSGILYIPRTNDTAMLAGIYSAAELFVSASREENYPTVHMEALSCGTPVLTYDVGGCAEIIDDTCGRAVPCGDSDALLEAARVILRDRPYSREACLKRAEAFDCKARFMEYLRLYRELTSNESTGF